VSPRPFTESREVRTSDGVPIATYELGGDGPPILLAHATGFHGLVWLPVASYLRSHFRCVAFDHRGHGRSGKDPDGSYDWSHLVLDTVAVIDGHGLGQTRAVGHSMGGGVLVMAEEAMPGTFRALYCYEAVVPAVDERLGPPPVNPLAASTRRRRETFPSRRAALENYAGKPPFSSFTPETIEAYVDYGFEDLPDGSVRLLCRNEDEARVYEGAMTNGAWLRLGQIQAPVSLACGAVASHFHQEAFTAMAARIREVRVEVLPGVGHFGPMEDPAGVAASIITAMDGWAR
jgi:pimeloyl-ACP methyl ester carboxylesterase